MYSWKLMGPLEVSAWDGQLGTGEGNGEGWQ